MILVSLMDMTEQKTRLKSIIYVLTGCLLILFAGLRDGDYVYDYRMYEWLYNDEIYVVELSFTAISLITRHVLGNHIVWLFMIYAVIGVWIKLVAIRRITPLLFLSLLIYVSDFYPLQEMAQMRASVATGIMLLAIKPLYERNLKRFILYTIIASLFHISSIVMIPLWFLKPGRINKSFWLFAVLIGYTLAFIKIDLISLLSYIPFGTIQEKYEVYRTQQEEGGYAANVFSLLFLTKLFLTLILLWKSDILASYNKYGYLLIKIMFVSLISLLLLSQNLAAGLRVSEFFGVVSIVLFPMLYYVIRPRWVAWIILVIAAIGFMTVRIFNMHLISATPL